MAIRERNQNLNMVTELVRTHLPATSDDGLRKDICAVIAINLRQFAADAEQSAKAWDKKAFHSKADALRRDVAWASPMGQVAESLAYSPRKLADADIARLQGLLPDDLIQTERPRFKNIEDLRGAAAAARQTVLKRR
ncbi:MAG: hypothetical protein K1X39_14765 [Thermoflexales bacterium]|nr:hypothetical protein [Thermoflexales bacterium]